MRKIAIVGGGQAGLSLALALLDEGYEVSVVTNRTPDDIRAGRVMSSQCMFDAALQIERDLGLNHWEKDCPPVEGIGLTVPHPEEQGAKLIDWSARLDRYAQSVDYRVKIPVWMQEVEQRGKLVIEEVGVAELEKLAEDNDLVILAAGKGTRMKSAQPKVLHRVAGQPLIEHVLACAATIRPQTTTVVIGHGLGGLLALKAAEQAPVGGLVLLSPEPPAALREAAAAHLLRDVPDVYGRARIGWSTLPEKLQRDHRDLTIGDVLRIQHLLGQKPHESGRARRSVLAGVPVEPKVFAEVPRLVIGAGLDQVVAEPVSERLASWLGAEYEPFGAHSHYGLIVGEQSHQQVADAIRSFLEAHRL